MLPSGPALLRVRTYEKLYHIKKLYHKQETPQKIRRPSGGDHRLIKTHNITNFHVIVWLGHTQIEVVIPSQNLGDPTSLARQNCFVDFFCRRCIFILAPTLVKCSTQWIIIQQHTVIWIDLSMGKNEKNIICFKEWNSPPAISGTHMA